MIGEAIVRPLVPADETAVAAFHRGLSPRTLHKRYFHALKIEVLVDRAAFASDYLQKDGSSGFVAERGGEVVGVARMTVLKDGATGEFGIVVADRWQRTGVGRKLMEALIAHARARPLQTLVGDVLPDNYGMQRFCKRLGFVVERAPGEVVVRVKLPLQPAAAST